jgi:hypothetical protein
MRSHPKTNLHSQTVKRYSCPKIKAMKFRPLAILLAFILAFALALPVMAAPNRMSSPPSQQSSKSDRTKQQAEIPKPNCDPSYPDVCIAPYPPDLNCGDISERGFRVTGSDPHKFDRDKDGIGCEG